MITIEQIKENIKCPQFGDLEYGEWGALRLEQRKAYKYLIDIVENLQQENKQLKSILTELEEWVKETSNYEEYDRVEQDTMNMILDKIQELKEKYK